jgi:hypothetical protein
VLLAGNNEKSVACFMYRRARKYTQQSCRPFRNKHYPETSRGKDINPHPAGK